ncbi:interleukin-1 receptor type 2-like isoform X4 [Carassius gibelio]|uniref:interleukin-1 receptor type 2-like isoform X4 n=1 Tax=Carassius gibelio TaxID=101364 RepID=UPI00227798AA|nr:interleukin-1 receptor type 2-like isoform X4 [Carassius gibelio]
MGFTLSSLDCRVESGSSGPSRVESGSSGPSRVESGSSGPSRVESGSSGPSRVESGSSGPSRVESGSSGPSRVESGSSGPSRVESGSSGPSRVESGSSGPSRVESGSSGPSRVESGSSGPSRVESGSSGPSRVESGSSGPSRVESGSSGPSRVESGSSGPSRVESGSSGPSRVESGSSGPSRVESGSSGPSRVESGSETQYTELKTYTTSAGLAFKLECSETQNVSWSRVPDQRLEGISGINIQGGALWFLPADLSHSGSYSCLTRNGDETWTTIFNVSVENKTCPRFNRKDEITRTKEITCLLPHIFEIDPQAQVTWRNNCHPLNVTNSKVLPINRSKDMIGLYTCFVSFTFGGQHYSAAQTTEIYSQSKDYVVTKPEIIYPKEETQKVKLGESYTLNCKALIGKNDNRETVIYWDTGLKNLKLDYNRSIVKEGERDYMLSTLYIPEVTEEHLYTNFTCVVMHPRGSDSGNVLLIPVSRNESYYWIGVGLVVLLILLCAVAFLFRVDLVLAYRAFCSSSAINSGVHCCHC